MARWRYNLPGPKRSFTVKENHIGSTVARSFATEKKLTSLYDILNVHIFNVFLIFGLKFYHHFLISINFLYSLMFSIIDLYTEGISSQKIFLISRHFKFPPLH